MAEARPQFQQLQLRFAAHLRDPERQPAPQGIEPRRLKIYRELFFNNVEQCLAAAFPVLRALLTEASWSALVRDFYAHHQALAPQFHRLPEEFLRYLEQTRGERVGDAPFLQQLAHYEWVELALSISPLSLPLAQADAAGDLLCGVPLLSPLAWTLAYDFPVQRIGPSFQPQQPDPAPTYLIVNRDREERVRFLEINAVTARLMALMATAPERNGTALLRAIAEEMQHPQPQSVIDAGAAIFRQLRERDIVLGTRC